MLRRRGRPGSGTRTAPRPRHDRPRSGASGPACAVTHGAPSVRAMPAIVRGCSDPLNSSSARSTLTSALVGTARTWRGSCGLRARARAAARGARRCGRPPARRPSAATSSGPRVRGSSRRLPAQAAERAPSSGAARWGAGRGPARRRARTRGSSPRARRARGTARTPACARPPGARNASVRSPLRIVRPQTSQETCSWTGRSSFFIASADVDAERAVICRSVATPPCGPLRP